MIAFAELLDRLSYTPSRNAKLKLLSDYFAATPDPDRGWALAALTDGLPFSFPARRILADLVAARVDAELFAMSRDYVGDTAETVALIWPPRAGTNQPPPRLSDVVEQISISSRDAIPALLETWLDALDSTGRWALLKLLTGAPRVGVSARLAKTALANLSGHPIASIEEVWHAVPPPYGPLLDWIAGGPRPDIAGVPVFRPLMLSHPVEPGDLEAIDPRDFTIEWKWDGIRVQIVRTADETRLYSRSGESIGHTFPDIIGTWQPTGVFDGELLIVRDGIVAPFSDLQQRLNRKSVTRAILERYPAHVRLYDALLIDENDLRELPLSERRRRLEQWHEHNAPPRSDLSQRLDVETKEALQRLWSTTRDIGIEGLMLKRRDSPYIAGRPRGHWFKWKREPLTADCVLMYAQRGSGKRSSYHSDFTFGAWTRGATGQDELVPVGKAYFGFTDEELVELDKWVRNNTAGAVWPGSPPDPRPCPGGCIRRRAALQPSQVRHRHAVSPHPPHPLGQARIGGRSIGNLGAHDRELTGQRSVL